MSTGVSTQNEQGELTFFAAPSTAGRRIVPRRLAQILSLVGRNKKTIFLCFALLAVAVAAMLFLRNASDEDAPRMLLIRGSNMTNVRDFPAADAYNPSGIFSYYLQAHLFTITTSQCSGIGTINVVMLILLQFLTALML